MSRIRKPIVHMANRPMLLVLGVVLTWVLAASVFALVEQTSIVDALYWSMTTMSTVGYGDISPVTVFGKFFTMAVQAWSIFVIVPCAVANIIDAVRVDEHKMTHEEQEWLFQGVEQIHNKMFTTPLPPQPKDY